MTCKSKGVRVMSARIIQNRFCEDSVGCKISVPVRQVDDVLGIHMWPDEVTCRRWNKTNSTRANNRSDGNDDNDNAASALQGRPERRGRRRARENGGRRDPSQTRSRSRHVINRDNVQYDDNYQARSRSRHANDRDNVQYDDHYQSDYRRDRWNDDNDNDYRDERDGNAYSYTTRGF